MYRCEICGAQADIHHIIYKSEGGLDFELNYKYLCPNHHRGKNGPHRNKEVDLKYKIELQESLERLLTEEYYSPEELFYTLKIRKNLLKKLTKNLKLYKEGYKSKDIAYALMGNKFYSTEMLEDFMLEKLLSNY
ncbi:HNH endonuclease [Clostridium polyendosporum]|uniref:HNH endonuclease n=1 Tax=Clostridium polyendosporum TaxID=69208 RepID=A0A919VFL4_9CLOT|nr:HNH endonuclease signature motif containing protein [Clostridium polyendosporum]GIM28545.1 HNH endonuclease [Clostridium polyendosporum]